ncbi:MAG: hypothetical protein ACFFBV_13825 [Promethearchaeota archaeon]
MATFGGIIEYITNNMFYIVSITISALLLLIAIIRLRKSKFDRKPRLLLNYQNKTIKKEDEDIKEIKIIHSQDFLTIKNTKGTAHNISLKYKIDKDEKDIDIPQFSGYLSSNNEKITFSPYIEIGDENLKLSKKIIWKANYEDAKKNKYCSCSIFIKKNSNWQKKYDNWMKKSNTSFFKKSCEKQCIYDNFQAIKFIIK